MASAANTGATNTWRKGRKAPRWRGARYNGKATAPDTEAARSTCQATASRSGLRSRWTAPCTCLCFWSCCSLGSSCCLCLCCCCLCLRSCFCLGFRRHVSCLLATTVLRLGSLRAGTTLPDPQLPSRPRDRPEGASVASLATRPDESTAGTLGQASRREHLTPRGPKGAGSCNKPRHMDHWQRWPCVIHPFVLIQDFHELFLRTACNLAEDDSRSFLFLKLTQPASLQSTSASPSTGTSNSASASTSTSTNTDCPLHSPGASIILEIFRKLPEGLKILDRQKTSRDSKVGRVLSRPHVIANV